MIVILCFIVVFCATGIFILQKVLKNTLATAKMSTAYNDKYYICDLIVQVKYDQPQFMQVVDFSRYDDCGLVYMYQSLSTPWEQAKNSHHLEREIIERPCAMGMVELYEIGKGVWMWRPLLS